MKLGCGKAGRSSGYIKPIVGIVGGIGSGKSYVSKCFEELGCLLIDSDKIAHEVLDFPHIKKELVECWGESVLLNDGKVSRNELAKIVFGDQNKIHSLNNLIHPEVDLIRKKQITEFASHDEVPLIIYDTPLLFEVGLDRECDRIIFVKVP